MNKEKWRPPAAVQPSYQLSLFRSAGTRNSWHAPWLATNLKIPSRQLITKRFNDHSSIYLAITKIRPCETPSKQLCLWLLARRRSCESPLFSTRWLVAKKAFSSPITLTPGLLTSSGMRGPRSFKLQYSPGGARYLLWAWRHPKPATSNARFHLHDKARIVVWLHSPLRNWNSGTEKPA